MRKKVKRTRSLKLKDYLQKVQWEEVAVELVGIEPSTRKELDRFQEAFASIQEMEPVLSDAQIVVEHSDLFSAFHKPFYHVYGREDPEDEGDTLALVPWAEWLGRDVVLDPPGWLPDCLIVAVCLYGMTSYGFSEEEIREEERSLKQDLEEIERHQDSDEEPEWDDDYPEDTMKEKLGQLRRWLRWGSVSREYFGENGTWFVDHFIGPKAPSYFDEIDRRTLKGALQEIAMDIVWVAKGL